MINWYPGHIAKAQRELKEKLKLCDFVIELVDARIPTSSRMDPILRGGKPRILIMTKADMAEPEATRAWLTHFRQEGPALRLNAQTGEGLGALKKTAAELGEDVQRKMAARGRLPRPSRVMVIGAPNVGKSSLINRLAGRKAANVADKAGVTRTPQWIRLADGGIELLDTPGLIPPRLDNQEQALMLALTGGIPTEALDVMEVARAGLDRLRVEHPHNLQKYGEGEGLEAVARALGYVLPGGRWDEMRAARRLLSDLRTGNLGPLTLERP